MKVDNLSIADVFNNGGNIHYVLPHFQRQYTWERKQWQTLWEDVLAVYEEYDVESPPEHFLGSLVVVDGGRAQGVIPVCTLVDGQQRLTTISLILCALRDYSLAHSDDLAQLANDIESMLMNHGRTGDYQIKLLPTTKYGDRDAYQTLILKHETTLKGSESGIANAFTYFRQEMHRRIIQGDIEPETFFQVLIQCFQVVFISLNRDESPYRIFESLNAKGKPLTQADLVRNYIAMKLPANQQEGVFKADWETIETLLQEKRSVGVSRIGELTAFLRHYLAMRSGVLCNEEHIYARFRDRMEQMAPADFVEDLRALRRFATYYDHFLRPENEQRLPTRQRLISLKILETATAYPLLLAAFNAQEEGELTETELCQLLDTIENYMVRRYLGSEQTSYLNRMFPSLWREIAEARTEQAGLTFVNALRTIIATKNCPTDRKIQDAVAHKALYRTGASQQLQKLRLVLERVNIHLSEGSDAITLLAGEPTIEHIMPQTLSDTWRSELGDDYEQIYQDYLDTLGNLTLVTQSWNSAISNASFVEKRAALSGHGLRLNSDYFSRPIEKWSDEAIRERARFLADNVLAIWPNLGEVAPRQVKQVKATPTSLRIGERIIPTTRWRDVVVALLEYCIQNNLLELAQKIVPRRFLASSGTRSAGWAVLSNGRQIYTYMSSDDVYRLCRRIFSAHGLTDSDWEITESALPDWPTADESSVAHAAG